MLSKRIFSLLLPIYLIFVGIFSSVDKAHCIPIEVNAQKTRNITFNVVAFPKNDNVKVNVHGEVFDMIENEYPLYSITINSFPLVNGNMSLDIDYYYIVNDEKENFVRTLPSSFQKTYNDFFGRKQTLYTYPTLKDPTSTPWSRSIGSTTVYDPSYIPTIYFHYTKTFFTNAPKVDVIKKITFIFKDEVITMTVRRLSSRYIH